MVEVNKNIAALSLKWLEILLDENDALSNEEKGEVQTLINFWRMYCSFTSEQFFEEVRKLCCKRSYMAQPAWQVH